MTETVVDIETLLSPVEGDNPAGNDLREDGSWSSKLRQVKDLREAARRNEKQLELDGGNPSEALEPWRKLRTAAIDVLSSSSKDLEVAAYLIEALVRIEGFAGLRDGMRLARGLVENFWDDVYPRPDDDGLETTVLPLQRLDGDILTAPIRRVAVTQDTSVGRLVTWQYRQAMDLKQCSPEERQTRIDRGAATKEMFDKAARETSTPFFQELDGHITQCLEELKLLAAALHERCPEHSPTYSSVEEALLDARSVVRVMAGPRLQEGKVSTSTGSNDGAEGTVVDNQVSGREDAFRRIEEIAAYFERTEPQSLIPVQLRKVVRWGRLSPAQLYTELIEDSSVREQIFKQVGIAEPKDESDNESSSES